MNHQRAIIEQLDARIVFSVVDGFIQSDFVAGLAAPTAMDFAPDGRLFVCQQGGSLRVVKNGSLLDQAAISLPVDSQGERGLLGVAFDPAFEQDGLIYLYYTTTTPQVHNRVSRFTVSGDTIDPASEQVLLDLPDLSSAMNHNGGSIHFGPDGKLYIGVGENANPPNSQSFDTTLGKILRINADGSIPADNPFIARTSGQNQAIWALGLRNPYTFAFDPASGTMHINDVGQSAFEEIDVGAAGANYGWPIIEGKRTTETPPDGYRDPLFVYPHTGDGPVTGDAITGGAFYRAPAAATDRFPAAMDGRYFFNDYVGGFTKLIDPASRKVSAFASGLSGPVDAKVGPDGGLYVLEIGAGRVTRFAADAGDLVTSIVGGPSASIVAGEKDQVTVEVSNGGSRKVSGRITLIVGLTDATNPDATPIEVGRIGKMIGLAAGQERQFGLAFRAPASVPGTFALSTVLVPSPRLHELDATNDAATASQPLTIVPRATDLAVSFGEAPPTELARGGRGAVVLTIANDGNVAFSGRVALRLRASADLVAEAADASLRLIEPRLKIPVGSSRAINVRFIVPRSLMSDNYFFYASVDLKGRVTETDLSNNAVFAEVATTVS